MGFFDGIINSVGSAIEGIGLKDVVAPLIGGVGSYMGQTSANNANAALMQQSNSMNAAEAEKNRTYQTEQRKTQYQTAVEDLKAAGLNPMLAYTQGGAKPTSGAQATAVAPPKMENTLGNAANSAATTAMALNNVMQNKLIQSQINKTDTESDNITADTLNKYDLNPNIRTENKRLLAEIAFKETAARLNSAMEYNQKAGIAPSSDPYWYRDLKRTGAAAASAFGIKLNR